MRLLNTLAEKLRCYDRAHGYTCDGCGAEVFGYPNTRLCERCLSSLSENEERVCPKCGRKTLAEGICLNCKTKPPAFTAGVSAYPYSGETASLINRLKNGSPRLALFFGECLADAFLRRFPKVKTQFPIGRYETNDQMPPALLVLPVPSTEERKKERGYNQAEELASALVDRLCQKGVSARMDIAVLQKRRETVQQKYLSLAERAKNVSGAYHLHERKKCKGETVLLVDDIMTTGATGDAIAALLKNAGANEVYFLTAVALPERK